MYGDAFPHETNMDRLHGVDFDKGCYVGQEVVSRMQHRGTARTRTVRVVLQDFSPEPGTPILAGDKSIGTMGSTSGQNGLALIRIDRAADALDAGMPLTSGGLGIRLADPDDDPSRAEADRGMTRSARLHADGLTRCPWPGEDPFYMAYHDTEWGVPEYDDRALYEKLILDGFQAGLSWITILRKRENFRKAFDDFQPEKIARYSEKKVHALMNDAGIVRNRAKIEGAVNSAKGYLKIMEEGAGFSKFLWDFVDGKPKVNNFKTTASVPASTPLSIKMSKELQARGFKFVGPTIVYAFMQATGMVNDHLVTCFCHRGLRRKKAQPPPQSKMTAKKAFRRLHPGLAADVVGTPARSAGPLAAGYRDRRYRPWPGAGRALERADQRRAYLLGGAAHAAGRGRAAPAEAADRRSASGSRPCCTMRRNMSSAT